MVPTVANIEKKNLPKRAFTPTKTFFWYFRPIAIICQLMGVLPLKNLYRSDSTGLKCSIVSIPFLYSVLFFGANVVAIITFAGPNQLVEQFQNINTSCMWRFIVLTMLAVRSIMCFVFCATHSRKLPKLIKVLDVFDNKKTKAFKATAWEALRRLFVWTLLPIIFGSAMVGIICVELIEFTYNTLPVNVTYIPWSDRGPAVFFGIFGVWLVVPILLYIYFSFILYYNFNYIRKMTKRSLLVGQIPLSEVTGEFSNFKSTLKNLCEMYFLMSDAVAQLNKAFGSFLAIDQFYIILMYVVNLYVYFFTDNKDKNLVICIIANAFIVVVGIYISHDVNEEADRVVHLMQKIPIPETDFESKVEIQLLLTQVFARSVYISAAGYFKMDRGQLPSICSAIATYLIVLIQFSPVTSKEGDGLTG